MNTVCLCKNCNNEELGEINNDTKLIEKLKKINLKQNLYYVLLVLFLVLVILDIIIRIQS